MNRKRATLLVCTIVLGLYNISYSQTKFGLTSGVNMSTISYDLDDEGTGTGNYKIGYSVGILWKFKLSESLGLETGLSYERIGESRELLFENADGYDRVTMGFLDVPLMFSYQINKVQLIFGPYIAVGIHGKNDFDYTVDDSSGEVVVKGEIPVHFGSVSDNPNFIGVDRLAYGLNLGLGYSFNDIDLIVQYGLGLNNHYNDTDPPVEDYEVKTRTISLNLNYYFGK